MSRLYKTCIALSVFLLAAGGIFSSAGKTDAPESISSSINELPMVDYGQEKLKEKLRFSKLLSSDIKTVVLDAGHGGKDRGCKGNHHTKEKEIALAITLQLGAYLESYYPDIHVIYTRKEDVFVPLKKRARIANEAKADLFISIHCNYIRNRPDVGGSETYVMGLHTADHNLNVAMRENAAITFEEDFGQDYEGYDPNSPESHILLSMYQNAYLERSILFAELVEQQIPKVSEGKHFSRGVRQAGFLVLKETAMPSVLIESGYLSNDNDEAYLRTDKGQRQVAFAIFKAFNIYKSVISNTKAEAIAASEYIEMPAVEPEIEIVEKVEETPVVEKKEPAKPEPKKQVNVAPIIKEKDNVDVAIAPQKVYKVQLVATPVPVNMKEARFARIAEDIEILKVDGLLKYLVSSGSDPSNARLKLEELRSNGFPKAFLSVYQGDERVQIVY